MLSNPNYFCQDGFLGDTVVPTAANLDDGRGERREPLTLTIVVRISTMASFARNRRTVLVKPQACR
jgi:hypothetical protein